MSMSMNIQWFKSLDKKELKKWIKKNENKTSVYRIPSPLDIGRAKKILKSKH